MKPTWARNLLMLTFTFGHSFKVKRWFTGFGELSFRWIQICVGSPMRRSSCFHFTLHITSMEIIQYVVSSIEVITPKT